MEKLDWIVELIRELEEYARTRGDAALLERVTATKIAFRTEFHRKYHSEDMRQLLGVNILSAP